MNKKYGFGIIGCGMISKWHAKAVESIEDAQLIGVTDNNAANMEGFCKEFSCRAFGSVDDMLSCPEIDVVCICTPSGLHAPMAVMCAKSGKHFVVEKPMAITKQQINDIICACEENNVKGTVISQFRFTPCVQYVKKAIEDGILGDIILGDVYMKYYRSAEYYASADWRGTWELDGGGALMNQGIHGIDLLQYLVGDVKSVCGVCKTLSHDIAVEDTASLAIEYKNGAVGTIQGTTSVNPGYPRVISISGTNGTIEITEDAITRWDVSNGKYEVKVNKANSTNSFRDPSGITLDNHRHQIADLVDAIKNDRRPLIDIYEGKKAVEIILAAYESSKTKSVVEL